MCGIAGIIAKNITSITRTKIKEMTDVIAHRGPDGEGQWVSSNGQVGLGHRRLSIIDLSHSADQPMHYLDRYSIVFNGEIYNYIELKEVLLKQGYTFKTESDTEVLMALYHRDKENCLKLLDGMFSFVIHDQKEQTVFCACDRFGEKPFFYSYEPGKHFYFGSEMKCLWAGGIRKQVNKRMLFNYISFGYINDPQDLSQTFYEDCTRLPHSHYIKIDLNTLIADVKSYYNINWQDINQSITIEQAKKQFYELFYTSVSRRLRSDVSVGSSLSGGLDSSLVVCVIDELRKNNAQKQNTFSAVFPGFERDERKYMDYVLAKTNAEPRFVTPTDEGMISDLDKLVWHQEEPFGSASIYVQYCVMKLAKENNVTVLLDGQGADEILAGYHAYYKSYFNELKRTRRSSYKAQYRAYLSQHSDNTVNGITNKTVGDRVRDISSSMVKPIKQLKGRYHQMTNPVFHNDFFGAFNKDVISSEGNNFKTLNEALYSSTYKGSLQTLLRYADRNSMASSREVRLPFLSHELVEFLFSLPTEFKINEGWTKWIMRESFGRILPKEIAWRKDKIGFEPPQRSWMEHNFVKDKIQSNKEKLVKQNVLHKSVLNDKVEGNRSNVFSRSWVYWMAGELF